MVEIERNTLIGYIIYYSDDTVFKTRDLTLNTWRRTRDTGVLAVIKYFSHKWGQQLQFNHWQRLAGEDFYFAYTRGSQLVIGMGDTHEMTLRGATVDERDIKGGEWIDDVTFSRIMRNASKDEKRKEIELDS